MTGKEEFEPLDELFRKTFQDLPETPAATGWDMPSPRVWQRVQVEIKPATSGWALQTWAVVGALALLLAAGLYYAYGKLQPKPLPPATAPTEQPVATPPVATPPQEISPSAPSEKPTVNPAAKTHPVATESRTNPSVNSSTPRGTDPSRVQATPLPGSKPVLPNSTEREKSQSGKEN